jgi:hypothetical protein
LKGFIVSPRVARVYDFLSRVGPAPFSALKVATGQKQDRLAKSLRALQGAGYAEPVWLQGIEFWTADGASFDLSTQETLAWFAARLEEAGGKYDAGQASFPGGQTLPIISREGQLEMGKFCFVLDDLQKKPLSECFREIRKGSE